MKYVLSCVCLLTYLIICVFYRILSIYIRAKAAEEAAAVAKAEEAKAAAEGKQNEISLNSRYYAC